MVSALAFGSSGPGSNPGRGHCVVFLSKTLMVKVKVKVKVKVNFSQGGPFSDDADIQRGPELKI